ncbi:MAG: hypothetical protein WCA19_10385 [Candidatus Acidiferrales bacterium]
MKMPPLDFLLVCSDVSLRDFELNRLNQAANLRKTFIGILDSHLQAASEALFARWLIEHREELLSFANARGMQTSFKFQASHILPAAAPPMKACRGKRSRKEICA